MRHVNLTHINHQFIDAVRQESGQNPGACIQCGKCSAGCPMNDDYDISVSGVMRFVQAGCEGELLSSKSIWLCAFCQTCSVRCPMEIDVAAVMETLRTMAWSQGKASEKKVKTFYKAFLKSIGKHGRVHELGMMVEYMLRSGRLATDIDLAPKTLAMNKLSLKPHEIAGKDEVAAIIERYRKKAQI